LKTLLELTASPGPITIARAPQGADSLFLARALPELMARRAAAAPGGRGPVVDLLHVAMDDAAMNRMADALAFFMPDAEILTFPAWDCLPYDRVSPNSEIVSRRIDTLVRLAQLRGSAPEPGARPRIVLTTINALLQRVPQAALLQSAQFAVRTGGTLDIEELTSFLNGNGYVRSDTVMEPGEYALRGGLIDVFPAGNREPLRLDLFGDTLERIRSFDPMTQRSTGTVEALDLKPVSEVLLNKQSIERFRTTYREIFGTSGEHDPLYESISAGHRHIGMEHWLPLFHEGLATLFDYLPDVFVTLDARADEARDGRLAQIEDFYQARRDLKRPGAASGEIYHPLPPGQLYLTADELSDNLASRPHGRFTPFSAPRSERVIDLDAKPGVNFAAVRHQASADVFGTLSSAINAEREAGRRVIIAAYSRGSRERMGHLLRDHGIHGLQQVADWPETQVLPADAIAMAVLGLETGFVGEGLCVISEQDVFGERLARRAPRARRSDAFLREITSIEEGDLVVHIEHGIGRYDGLVTLDIAGAPHDCLRVLYDGGDKLFVPVENIDVLSRYGEDQGTVSLDKLGGAAWQARKARLKKRIRDMADGLLRIAAARQLSSAESMPAPEGLYEEFAARFPYHETDDQLAAIEDTLKDLTNDRPMDRLICGDVGFGKTEVALRAAFVATMSGAQVAVVVPTTLLARQHYETFRARFEGFPVRINQLSRLTPTKAAPLIKKELTSGHTNIVVGTHALLAKNIEFSNLGLLIVDEEQHFGVAHKERLKALRSNVHVLTLTATPIPRTLQLALTGVKELSIIATPPVDRLAVRTFVLPFDPVVVREALLRERFRGGQSFYVCPRIQDIEVVRQEIMDILPDAKLAAVHGQMSPTVLEETMQAFNAGQYEILLSTNIIESGLDMPNVNTMIIHRADMFGLAQLYQLRGRVGRSKLRAYAYLTLPTNRKLTPAAEKRLQVMQTLDNLGAGFSLASHDLDIRGAGNLLGEEQSGHIREVGIELYQQMLEEAVASLRGEDTTETVAWTPQIGVGIPVLIPEAYVPDLSLRLGLYRRVAQITDPKDVDAFASEIVDRFGPMPPEADNLLKVVALKTLCRAAGIDKVDAGPKGAVLSFRDNKFNNPEGLVGFISGQAGSVRLRPDHKLVYRRNWENPLNRIAGLEKLVQELVGIATRGKAA
jgi:transcription-repair coupling factor (superfamily II helicase)